jgi:hypothetical protein
VIAILGALELNAWKVSPMSWSVRGGTAVTAMVVALSAVGCGGDGSSTAGTGDAASGSPEATPVIDPGDGGDYQPDLDPANFVDVIDNPYLPFQPGMRWVYEGESDGEAERIEVVVTGDRRDIQGISATVVRDTVHVAGELVEDTYDWFAQDAEGNVWYVGEDSTSYEPDGTTSKDGSWEYGVDGALPGIVMLADPSVGDSYRQEFYPDEAEDLGEVISVDETKTIGIGEYTDVVVTEDWNPLDPETIENKYYAPGVGKIYSEHTRGDPETVELVEFTAGS